MPGVDDAALAFGGKDDAIRLGHDVALAGSRIHNYAPAVRQSVAASIVRPAATRGSIESALCRNALKAMLAARKFDPYISHIRFPHYKNLAPDLKIDFDFPITALVGPNGTNKSSILRAIQGLARKRKSWRLLVLHQHGSYRGLWRPKQFERNLLRILNLFSARRWPAVTWRRPLVAL
jgi:hypothetical protein